MSSYRYSTKWLKVFRRFTQFVNELVLEKIRIIMLLLMSVSTTITKAQVVENVIATEQPISEVVSYENNLILCGSFTEIGRPGHGFYKLTKDSFLWIDDKDFNIHGTDVKVVKDGVGGFFAIGNIETINGYNVNDILVHVNVDGIPDPKFNHEYGYEDRRVSPFDSSDGVFTSIKQYGDTLFLAGKISNVDSVKVSGLIAFRISTGELIDWNPEFIYDNIDFESAGNLLICTSFANEYHENFQENMFNFDMKTLEFRRGISTNDWFFNSVKFDSQAMYFAGEHLEMQSPNKYGWVERGISVFSKFDHQMPIRSPKTNGFVIDLVSDNTGGYYAAGSFTRIDQHYISNLARVDSRGYVDTSFNLQIIGQVEKLLILNSILYIGGRISSAGGKSVKDICAYDLNTKSFVDPGFTMEVSRGLSDLVEMISYADSFIIISGLSKFNKVTVEEGCVLINTISRNRVYFPPNGIYYMKLNGDDLLFASGKPQGSNSSSLHRNSIYRYNLKSRTFDTTGWEGLGVSYGLITGIEITDSNIFVGGSFSVVKNGVTYSNLIKFNRYTEELMDWKHYDFKQISLERVKCFKVVNDSIWFVSQDNIKVVDVKTGGVSKSTHNFDIGLTGITSFGNKVYLFGRFRFLDFTASTVIRTNLDGTSVNKKFHHSEGISDLAVTEDYIYILGENTRELLKVSRKDYTTTSLITFLGASFKAQQIIIQDTVAYISGYFNTLQTPDRTQHSRDGLLAYDIKNEKVLPADAAIFNRFSTVAVVAVDSVLTVQGGELVNMNKTPYMAWYDEKADSFISNPLDLLGTDAKARVYGDSLYILNGNVLNKQGERERQIVSIYDLKRKQLMSPILTPDPYQVRFYDMLKWENYLIICGALGQMESNVIIYDLTKGKLLTNVPVIKYAHCLWVKDSILYVGGELINVNSKNNSGLVKINLRTMELIPFPASFKGRTYITRIREVGDRICLMSSEEKGITYMGYNSVPYLFIDHETGLAYDEPTLVDKPVNDIFVLNDKIVFCNDEHSKAFDFNNYLPWTSFNELQVKCSGMYKKGEKVYAYGQSKYTTDLSYGHIAALTFDSSFWTTHVSSFSPKSMSQTGEVQMVIRGNGLVSGTTVKLLRQSDTIVPISGSYEYTTGGDKIKVAFNNMSQQVGKYDLLIDVPNDTVIALADTVKIDSFYNNGLSVNWVGFDTVRPSTWYFSKLLIANNSNADLKNVPVMIVVPENVSFRLVEGLVINNELVYFDSSKNLAIDSLFGKPYKGRVFSYVVPRIPAEANAKIAISLKFKVRTKVDLHVVVQSPLLDSSDIGNAYARLHNIVDTKCVRSIIRDFNTSVLNRSEVTKQGGSALYSFQDVLKNIKELCSSNGQSPLVAMHTLLNNDTRTLNGYIGSAHNIDAYSHRQAFNFIESNPRQIVVVESIDPNIKLGLSGYGNKNYVKSIPSDLYYEVHFENDSSATASVQKLVITDSLDKNSFDLSSIEFNNFSLGDYYFQFESGQKQINQTFDLIKEYNVLIWVQASLNAVSGVVTWKFQALDPTTFSVDHLNPTSGFLPPNSDLNNGKGFVGFTAKRKQFAGSIKNKASIIFDNNEAIETPFWHINEDVDKPSSFVLPLPLEFKGYNFNVSWTGWDSTSAVSSYDIYYSVDSTLFLPWLIKTMDTSHVFNGRDLTHYYFYSIATDAVGNKETKDTYHEAKTFLGLPNTNGVNNGQIKLYPNPNDGKFFLETSLINPYRLMIINSTGQIVGNYDDVNSDKLVLNLTVSGLYYVVVEDVNGNRYTSKLVVSN